MSEHKESSRPRFALPPPPPWLAPLIAPVLALAAAIQVATVTLRPTPYGPALRPPPAGAYREPLVEPVAPNPTPSREPTIAERAETVFFETTADGATVEDLRTYLQARNVNWPFSWSEHSTFPGAIDRFVNERLRVPGGDEPASKRKIAAELMEAAVGTRQGDVYRLAAQLLVEGEDIKAAEKAYAKSFELGDREAPFEYVEALLSRSKDPRAMARALDVERSARELGIFEHEQLSVVVMMEQHRRQPTEQHRQMAQEALDSYLAAPTGRATGSEQHTRLQATIHANHGEFGTAVKMLAADAKVNCNSAIVYARTYFAYVDTQAFAGEKQFLDRASEALENCRQRKLGSEERDAFDTFKRVASDWVKARLDGESVPPFATYEKASTGPAYKAPALDLGPEWTPSPVHL